MSVFCWRSASGVRDVQQLLPRAADRAPGLRRRGDEEARAGHLGDAARHGPGEVSDDGDVAGLSRTSGENAVMTCVQPSTSDG